MNVKREPVQITIRPRTIVKGVCVAYLTWSFLSVLDRQLGRKAGPQVDKLVDKLAAKSDEMLDEWSEAVKEA